MHVLIGRKQILLSALVVMLGLAVFVNWYYTSSGKKLSPEGQSPAGSSASESGKAAFTSSEEVEDYFSEMKLARSANEASVLEELEAVMAGAEPGSDEAGAAGSAIAVFTQKCQRQADIENLVSAGIGSDCVAVISDNSIDVVVTPSALNEQSVLAISDIIRTVCGADYENIRVSAAVAPASAG